MIDKCAYLCRNPQLNSNMVRNLTKSVQRSLFLNSMQRRGRYQSMLGTNNGES